MKFVIRSLLFVNLILQMTTSLRKCFDQDQNIMITIILLAFSVIGLIGLVIGNRFILIVFSASMTLILIASITIYAIGKTDQDSMKPKVPYYTTIPLEPADDNAKRGDNDENRLKSLVGKWFNRDIQSSSRNKKGRNNRTRSGSSSPQRINNSRQRMIAKKSSQNTSLPLTISPVILDDYTDESSGLVHVQVPLEPQSPDSRSLATAKDQLIDPSGTGSSKQLDGNKNERDNKLVNKLLSEQQRAEMTPDSDPLGESPKVESEQWVAYERYLYERYLNIISQSIDLVLLTILAAWMALLLDEDSDQCFGTKSSTHKDRSHSVKEAPVYNYNGVRYSIRPDVGDSPARVIVR